MKVLTPNLIHDKRVLLRYDFDVPIKNGKVVDDFRLTAGLETLNFCLMEAESVVLMGHVGRPSEGQDRSSFSVKPIVEWFEDQFGHINLPKGKLHILENLRFEKGEDDCNLGFARELAAMGDVFINEAFASHHPAASTTVLPKIMSDHAAGFNFAEEVDELSKVMNSPQKPFVAIIGGIKVEDKLPAILSLAEVTDTVLVGGRLSFEVRSKELTGQIDVLPPNVHLAKLNPDGTDIAEDTLVHWEQYLKGAQTILWNGPMGKFEDQVNTQTKRLAEIISSLSVETIVGGGDTVAAINEWGLLEKFSFVSTGGGAMLKFLTLGTLPTIEALE